MAKNFSFYEMELLTTLIDKYKDIITCKESNVTSLAMKNITWETLTQEYNACNGIMKRTVKQLRMKYKNMKRDIHKRKAQDRHDILKTGELNASIIENALNEKLASMGALVQPLTKPINDSTYREVIQSSPEETNSTELMTFEVIDDLSAVIKQEVDDTEELETHTAPIPSEPASILPKTASILPEPNSIVPEPTSIIPEPTSITSIIPEPTSIISTIPEPTSIVSENSSSNPPASSSYSTVPPKETTEVPLLKEWKTPAEKAAEAVKEKVDTKVKAIERELQLKEKETEVTISSTRLKNKLMQEEHDLRMKILKEEHALKMRVLASKLRYYESSTK